MGRAMRSLASGFAQEFLSRSVASLQRSAFGCIPLGRGPVLGREGLGDGVASLEREGLAASLALLGAAQVPSPACLMHWRALSSSAAGTGRAGEAPGISKILVANRGEIACRVMCTAKRLGISSVAVYSDTDKYALHVQRADEAIRIGPPLATQSYLRGEAILEAALRTGAQAVHPGYGFLSENADFAEMCAARGIEFMGPPAAAIRAMGDKSAAKELMTSAGVPVVPGYHGEEQSEERLVHEAERIGFPLLIKATQGGGGKGMRIVRDRTGFREGLHGAIREAVASFGNGRVLLERYIQRPRHVEVQIFGDKPGNVVHLFERDCSVQRRHQKILEESPAPGLSEAMREQLGLAAVSAAKAVQYESAGTVEFIFDCDSGEFFFMEMNTRLQVEHPVTEMVVGQDLVEWQIRVANGQPLPLTQNEIRQTGHAFEARIYAENVPKGFLPASGPLLYYGLPDTSPAQQFSDAVRVETGVRQGDVISTFYDPLIAKLVVSGATRAEALERLRQSLAQYHVAGLTTNLPLLRAVAAHATFQAGDVDTHFLERHKETFLPDLAEAQGASALRGVLQQQFTAWEQAAAGAAVGLCAVDRAEELQAAASQDPWHDGSGFRVNSRHRRHFSLSPGNEGDSAAAAELASHARQGEASQGAGYRLNATLDVEFMRDGSFAVHRSPKQPPVSVTADVSGLSIYSAPDIDGHPITVRSAALTLCFQGRMVHTAFCTYRKGAWEHIHLWVKGEGGHQHFTRAVPLFVPPDLDHPENAGMPAGPTRDGVPGAVISPMAGRVVRVCVEERARVERGQPLVILESMKMEHTVRAPLAGSVGSIAVAQGQQVGDGALLAQIQPES